MIQLQSGIARSQNNSSNYHFDAIVVVDPLQIFETIAIKCDSPTLGYLATGIVQYTSDFIGAS